MKPSVSLSPINNRLATVSDLPVISSIIFACSTRLKENNSPDWAHYYTPERIIQKLIDQIAFLFYKENIPVGVVFLSDNGLYYYTATDLKKFTSPDSPSIYISTLAVRPEYQRQGIATQIIKFCESFAANKNVTTLRLDCNGKDNQLVDFYKRNGFVVLSPMTDEPDYLLLEKIIAK
jgi:GNAT superfamily N-acetyltransferase